MGVLFITHDLGVVSEVADRVVVMYCGQVVEEAEKIALFEKPLHPYTLGLLESIPRVEDDESKRLFTIPGTVPNPLDMPSGCPFSTRCNRCMERCRKERPRLTAVPGQPDRRVRCFLYECAASCTTMPQRQTWRSRRPRPRLRRAKKRRPRRTGRGSSPWRATRPPLRWKRLPA